MHSGALAPLSLMVLLSAAAGCRGPELSCDGALPGVVDLRNRPVNPFNAGSGKAIVFIFVGVECPISNRYAPEIERLYREFEPRSIAFWLVYPDADSGPPEIARHRKDYGLSLPVLRDPQHSLVKRARVSVTPEAAVFSSAGRELYHGRIDDRMVDFGKERPFPIQRDLQMALNDILGGKPINGGTTMAVGCPIPDRQ